MYLSLVLNKTREKIICEFYYAFPNMTDSALGFIGLGKMGWRMADLVYRKIQASGEISLSDTVIKKLVVYDSRRENTSRFSALHPETVAAEDLKQVGEMSDIVWIMIPNEAVKEVVLTLAEHMKRNGTIIDGGNSDPRNSIQLARDLEKRGLFFIDVGCSGGPYKVGDLSLMVGGEERIYHKILPLLKIFGKPVYVGPSGMGHIVKMVHNDLEYILMAGIAEIFSWLMNIAPKLIGGEIDVIRALKAINNGLAQSKLLELTIEVLEEKGDIINDVKPYVSGGGQASWTLEMSNEFPMPFTALALLQRKLSREENYKELLEKIGKYVEMLEKRKDERFPIQALLRNRFGGHAILLK